MATNSTHHDHHGGHVSIIIALVLKVGYMFADIIGGVLSGSLALPAHAGHILTDAAQTAVS